MEKERFNTEIAFLKKGDASAEKEDDEKIDSYEVFDMLRHINDPEHPLTLE